MKWLLYIGLWSVCTTVYGQVDSVYLQSYNWITGSRETVPAWITEAQGEGRFIGVSDPGLKPEIARQQALVRAWMLAMLDSGVEVAMVKDYYLQTKIRFEYESVVDKLVLLLTLTPVIKPVCLEKAREWISQYGECFAEYYSIKENAETAKDVSLLLTGNDAGIRGEALLVSNGNLQERQELRIDWQLRCPEMSGVKECDFLLRGNKENNILTLKIDGFDLPLLKRGRYWYYDTDSSDNVNGTFCSLEDALWRAISESMLYALSAHSFPEVTLRNLEEESGQIRETLKREFVKARIQLSVKGVYIQNNRLYADWQIRDIDSIE